MLPADGTMTWVRIAPEGVIFPYLPSVGLVERNFAEQDAPNGIRMSLGCNPLCMARQGFGSIHRCHGSLNILALASHPLLPSPRPPLPARSAIHYGPDNEGINGIYLGLDVVTEANRGLTQAMNKVGGGEEMHSLNITP